MASMHSIYTYDMRVYVCIYIYIYIYISIERERERYIYTHKTYIYISIYVCDRSVHEVCQIHRSFDNHASRAKRSHIEARGVWTQDLELEVKDDASRNYILYRS